MPSGSGRCPASTSPGSSLGRPPGPAMNLPPAGSTADSSPSGAPCDLATGRPARPRSARRPRRSIPPLLDQTLLSPLRTFLAGQTGLDLHVVWNPDLRPSRFGRSLPPPESGGRFRARRFPTAGRGWKGRGPNSRKPSAQDTGSSSPADGSDSAAPARPSGRLATGDRRSPMFGSRSPAGGSGGGPAETVVSNLPPPPRRSACTLPGLSAAVLRAAETIIKRQVRALASAARIGTAQPADGAGKPARSDAATSATASPATVAPGTAPRGRASVGRRAQRLVDEMLGFLGGRTSAAGLTSSMTSPRPWA